MSDFAENKKWEEAFFEDVKRILESQLPNITKIEISAPEDDMTHATDVKISFITGGNVAVRTRRETFYRDFTIRAYSNNEKTELQKLREGHCDWYLYAWTEEDSIKEWVLIDLNKMRECGLLDEDREVIMNRDGRTGFVAYTIEELEAHGLIVAKNLHKPLP